MSAPEICKTPIHEMRVMYLSSSSTIRPESCASRFHQIDWWFSEWLTDFWPQTPPHNSGWQLGSVFHKVAPARSRLFFQAFLWLSPPIFSIPKVASPPLQGVSDDFVWCGDGFWKSHATRRSAFVARAGSKQLHLALHWWWVTFQVYKTSQTLPGRRVCVVIVA